MEEKKNINTKALLAVLFGAAFIAAFNENLVNVGLVDIMAEFGIGSGVAQWMVTGYMIVTTIVVTVVAFLQKRYSLPQIFFAGAGVLLVGSAGDVVAPTWELLLAFRLLQSVGTGIFIPTMMASVLAIAPRKKLGAYLAVGSCCITFGPAFGPVAAGFMVTFFGWRTMFLLPAASMILLMVAGALFVRPIAQRQAVKIDLPSLLLSACGLTAFVYGLGELTSNLPLALGALAAGAVLLGLFAWRQGKLETPLLNLKPLRNPHFSIACLLVVVSMMSTFSMSVLLPLYFQGVDGMPALAAGLLVLAPILFNAVTALAGGRIFDRHGEWPLLPVGFGLIAVGMAGAFAIAPTLQTALLVGAACIIYAGVGLVMSPSQTAGLKTLPRDMNSYGVALMSTFIQLAAAVGPSLYVGILSTTVVEQTAAGQSAAQAQAAGFASAVLVALVVSAIGFIVSTAFAHTARAAQPARADTGAAAQPEAFTLSNIMKHDAFTVRADEAVHEAVKRMLEHHTSGLPIVDASGAVVGFISDGDIMKSLANADSNLADLTYSLAVFADDETFGSRLHRLMTDNVMNLATTNVVSVDADAPIEEVCSVLGKTRIKKAPVLKEGRLVGTVSRNDVNRALLEGFVSKKPASA